MAIALDQNLFFKKKENAFSPQRLLLLFLCRRMNARNKQ